MTGYPSIDKPWQKYYSEEAIAAANGSIPLPDKTFYQFALESNQNGMNDIAFTYYGNRISYKAFFANVKDTADALAAMGICKGDIVTIMSMQTPETINLIFALNYIGATANMVYISLSGKELLETISSTNSKALFALEIALDKVDVIAHTLSIPVVILAIRDSMPLPLKMGLALKNRVKHPYIPFRTFVNRKSAGTATLNLDPESVAVLVYTSGTTGHPKAVMVTNRNLCALIFQYQLTDIQFGRGETFLDLLPPFLGYGIGMMAIAICNGINSILWIQPEAKQISRQFWKQKPNHIELGKAHAMQIIEDCPADADLRFVINFGGGGESVSEQEQNKINDFLRLHGARNKYVYGYGMTECASGVCTNSSSAYKTGSLGIPLPCSVMKIVDIDTRAELPYGREGEICIMSPNVMLGFYHNEAETEKVIEIDQLGNRWLKTGDLGYIDEDGFVFLTGRIKRLFLIKGGNNVVYKLFPQQIEEVLKQHPFVKNCGIIAVKDEKRYHRPVAFIEIQSNEENASLLFELKQLINENLPDHSRPEEIICLKNLPITLSGKVDYKALEKLYADKKAEV